MPKESRPIGTNQTSQPDEIWAYSGERAVGSRRKPPWVFLVNASLECDAGEMATNSMVKTCMGKGEYWLKARFGRGPGGRITEWRRRHESFGGMFDGGGLWGSG